VYGNNLSSNLASTKLWEGWERFAPTEGTSDLARLPSLIFYRGF